jgi:hypothetical protein
MHPQAIRNLKRNCDRQPNGQDLKDVSYCKDFEILLTTYHGE